MNFPLNFSFYLNYYNFFFLAWGNIFWELKKISGTNGPISTPANKIPILCSYLDGMIRL